MGPHPHQQITLAYHSNGAYHSQRPYEAPTSPHAYVNQQPPNPTPFDFNQSIVELFRHQTKLTHNTQQLHQPTTDALENIAKSSSFHFFTIYPSLKLKTPNLLMAG